MRRGDAATRRIGLQVKVVLVLLVISAVPLAVSAVVIGGISKVAQSFASNQAARMHEPLTRAEDAYRQLIAAKKSIYQASVTRLRRSLEEDGEADTKSSILRSFIEAEPDVVGATLVDAKGELVAEASRNVEDLAQPNYQELSLEEQVGGGRLEVVFAADAALAQDFIELGRVLEESKRVDSMKGALPTSYRLAFLFLVGGVVVIVTAAGIFLAGRLTGRIAHLVEGTREVATGNLDARVELRGTDELAELARTFNAMVTELERDRQQIVYLQRIGAWQDVARKLAHEIKNPLTPIQLAMQQCVSAYDGDDTGFETLLAQADEIVREEIASLRRLVDAFSDLGRLPKVEPTELDLAQVVEDLGKDPVFADHLEVRTPPESVLVRGDRLLLRRVVANLIENGKHAGEGIGVEGGVIVEWRADGGQAILTVDDRGPGVDAATRERIFEPYVTSKDFGTGLGLAISKKIAIDHGGSLSVAEEPAPTGGARFILTIPLAS